MSRFPGSWWWRSAAVVLALTVVSTGCRAAAFTWVGLGASDSWTDPANWETASPDFYPGYLATNDTAEFTSLTQSYTAAVSTSGLIVSSLIFTGTGYSLSISGGFVATNGISATDEFAPDLDVDASFSFGGTATVRNLTGSGGILSSVTPATLRVVGPSSTFSGTLQGDLSLIKAGSGTLTLTADSDFTGPTTVEAGTLLVDGVLVTDVVVRDEAVFGGDGVVGDIILESGATLVPIDCFDADSLTWESGAGMLYALGDEVGILELVDNLTKDGDGPFAFTFEDGGWETGYEYPLIFFDDTDFVVGDFSFTNNGGFDGFFTLEENALRFTVTSVPEPSVSLLAMTGLIVAFGRRRLTAK